ncbi:hypothetical protein Acid345_3192 [Candidatus Koribacter versatilis Ellin345]|uniref:30S ribosomal protein S20 n=1 Tax=Koribacter versatilis (strain Ellin345) TaxID=204669 RepID=Q1ILQ7_KORVE|nr:hypothetical protein [Candidatus Koribacter versatilis]ABF42193.1 hypothetical protein Acid345_3192 [Candidatus Koribacter versatilis Ellin345]
MSKFIKGKRAARAHHAKAERRAKKHNIQAGLKQNANTAYGRTAQGLRKTLDRLVKKALVQVKAEAQGVERFEPADQQPEGGAQ